MDLLINNGTPLNVVASCGSALHVAINKDNVENAIYLIQETSKHVGDFHNVG